MSEYGSGTIFKMRIDILTKKAAQFFMLTHDQRLEGDFDKLVERALGFSQRRNEIAHGIAFSLNRLTFFRQQIKPNLLSRDHFAVIPTIHARYADGRGYPVFAYTSVEMKRIVNRLDVLTRDIE